MIIETKDGRKFEVSEEQEIKKTTLKITKEESVINIRKDVFINNVWAYTPYLEEQQDEDKYNGSIISGHGAMLYLLSLHGTWYNQQGEKIDGRLYFKPKSEE